MRNVLVDSLRTSWAELGGLVSLFVDRVWVNNSTTRTYAHVIPGLYPVFYTARVAQKTSVKSNFCTLSPALINKTSKFFKKGNSK